ncbi:hypothetical protein KFL_005560110 [Klebsormidium nitens]|uniref:Uncharacterized protein n=1 Tax=Klebsormidium nitens TaxID=105231 RepID=A0A1Y1II30_KLENI|nr:hypothetical protein KFL_005560110 [Klebsormidium nitens]|eukprot:GAQ89732.1 hypothetical protein KFL_005560110 [Klebsormidium nitens]
MAAPLPHNILQTLPTLMNMRGKGFPIFVDERTDPNRTTPDKRPIVTYFVGADIKNLQGEDVLYPWEENTEGREVETAYLCKRAMRRLYDYKGWNYYEEGENLDPHHDPMGEPDVPGLGELIFKSKEGKKRKSRPKKPRGSPRKPRGTPKKARPSPRPSSESEEEGSADERGEANASSGSAEEAVEPPSLTQLLGLSVEQQPIGNPEGDTNQPMDTAPQTSTLDQAPDTTAGPEISMTSTEIRQKFDEDLSGVDPLFQSEVHWSGLSEGFTDMLMGSPGLPVQSQESIPEPAVFPSSVQPESGPVQLESPRSSEPAVFPSSAQPESGPVQLESPWSPEVFPSSAQPSLGCSELHGSSWGASQELPSPGELAREPSQESLFTWGPADSAQPLPDLPEHQMSPELFPDNDNTSMSEFLRRLGVEPGPEAESPQPSFYALLGLESALLHLTLDAESKPMRKRAVKGNVTPRELQFSRVTEAP